VRQAAYTIARYYAPQTLYTAILGLSKGRQLGRFHDGVYAGLEYRLFKPFALGAAYDRLVISAESAASNGFRADVNWNLLYLYGTLYLF
jgi:hypothetical protein